MPSKETQKYTTWGLAASTVVFTILSIVFICLFATKHEDSSSFLLTATSSKSAADANGEINRILSNSYHVNSLQTDEKNGVVTSVFSLRGKQNAKYVQDRIGQSSVLLNSIVTDGSSSNSVCHHFDSVVGPSKTTTAPDTATDVDATTTQAVKPPQNTYYCDNIPFKRDIYIVVDTLPDGSDDTNVRAGPLTTLGNRIASKLQFGENAAQVFLVAADDKGYSAVSKAFTKTTKDFQEDWAKMVALPDGSKQAFSLNMDKVFEFIEKNPGRKLTPVEVIILTAHNYDMVSNDNNLKEKGVFVSVVKATQVDIAKSVEAVSSTGLVDLKSWVEVAVSDPFGTLVCQYYYQDNTNVKPQALLSNLMLAAADPVDNSCQKVDIIFVFDTSQSVVPIFIQDYKDWAESFVSRFTLTGAKDGDNVRVGIIQFSETANVLMPLQETTQVAFNHVVDGILFTGGLTNTKAALIAAKQQFGTAVAKNHGKFVIFMTDGEPTVGTLDDSISAGTDLRNEGVDIFFMGDAGYDTDTKNKLAQINGNAAWIYDTPAVANIQLPQTMLQLFPCPIPICEIAYYAIEVSEATEGSNFLYTSLHFAQKVAAQVAQQKPNSLFQIMLYNDQTYFLPTTATTFDAINATFTRLLNDQPYLFAFMDGHTRLDLAINALSTEISNQIFLNELFQSSVLFAGEANYYTLDPHCPTFDDACEPQRKQQLANAGAGLRARTNLVYAFDGSLTLKPYGDDLWTSAVDKSKIIDGQSKAPMTDLTNAKYYDNVAKLSCQMPVLDRCDYSILDIAVILDVVGDDSNVKPYLASFLNQFKTTYSTHISMFAIGSGHPVTTLGSLGAYNATTFSSQMFWEYERWRLGEAIYTTEMPTTEATTQAAPAKVEAAAGASPMTAAVIKDMFAALQGQFGCGHYDDYNDRIRAPNVIILMSDNFASYTPDIWNAFPEDVSNSWTCDDCPGKPQFYFLSLTDDIPAHGTSWKIEGTDFDLTKAPSIRKLSGIIDQVCVTPMPVCASYTPATICLPTPVW